MAAVHGRSRYTNHGCRCDVCRTAHAAYNRQLRGRAVDPALCPSHLNYRRGCRCTGCREKHNAYARVWAQRQRAAKAGTS